MNGILDVSPEPLPEVERLELARQPAFSLYAFFLGSQITLAAALQFISSPFGLLYSELFLFLAPVVLWARGANWRLPSLFQLRSPGAGPIALGFLAGAANFLVAGALQAGARALLPQELAKRFDSTALFEGLERPELAVLLTAVAVVAPLCEELAFRGFIQPVLRARHRRSFSAVFLTAVLFSALHLDPVGMVARVELGIVFGLLAVWTGSLWPAIAAHAANNLIASGLVIHVLRREPSTSAEPLEFGRTLAMALVAAVVVAGLLSLARRHARPGQPESAEGTPGAGHVFDPARVQGWVRAWLLLGASSAALIVVFGWPAARINLVDVQEPLQELTRRLPDEGARRTFKERLQEARRSARRGEMDLEAYRALRQRLSGLEKAAPEGANVSLERALSAFEGAKPSPAPPPPPAAGDAGT
ncbi:MAG: CPBP family intramembrane metalloprotease [Deltaproteobacteria bacterium]|nr:CPBP family intramembrane metalloprotease [Deltaproteobacteria bacterium]